MKIALCILLLLLSIARCEEEIGQIDPDVDKISNFLIKIIEKYDISGIGAIPIEKYPSFLSDVFLTGNSVSQNYVQIQDPVKDLLLDATTKFSKKYNTTQVGIQQFYMDLLKDFTEFLTANEQEYKEVLQTFFDDTPDQYEDDEIKQEKQQIEL